MSTNNLWLVILAVVVALVILRPLFGERYKHDSTACFTGGLGSGKTLSAVRVCKSYYVRVRVRWEIRSRFLRLFKKPIPEKPLFLSNIPVRCFFKEYSHPLTRDYFVFKNRVPVGSCILIDEVPQFIDNTMWGDSAVRTDLNEFFTFFRHYVGGLLVCTAQSIDEVECHLRRKLSCYYYVFDFSKFLCFYHVNMLKSRAGDVQMNLTSDYIEDNAIVHWGLLWPRSYSSRCFAPRYDVVSRVPDSTFTSMETTSILRFDVSFVTSLDRLIKGASIHD